MECGEWSVECGELSVDCGVSSVECEELSVECGLFSVECGVWSHSTQQWSHPSDLKLFSVRWPVMTMIQLSGLTFLIKILALVDGSKARDTRSLV